MINGAAGCLESNDDARKHRIVSTVGVPNIGMQGFNPRLARDAIASSLVLWVSLTADLR